MNRTEQIIFKILVGVPKMIFSYRDKAGSGYVLISNNSLFV